MTGPARAALVTGGSGGIGSAVVRRLARDGFAVGIGCLRGMDKAVALAAEVETAGGRALPVPLDVRDPAGVDRGVAACVEAFGRLDAVAVCSGVAVSALLAGSAVEDIRRQLDVNLLGALLVVRRVLPEMLERGGSIVLLSSVSARHGTRGQAAYAATRGGVEAMARSLAVEYGRRGIRVNCVAPGPVDTPMLAGTLAVGRAEVLARVPLGRLGTPDEIAEAVAYLAGDRATFVTGAVLAVDGGSAA